MVNIVKLIIGITVLTALSATGVFAYVDPGTGATILGSLWPLVVAMFTTAAAFFIKRFWEPIKKMFKRKKKK